MTAASAPAAALPTTEAGGDARFSNTFLRLKKKLERGVGEAIGDYNMIGDGDTVMVCVSGGKDSYTLLSCLLALRERVGRLPHRGDEPRPEAARLPRPCAPGLL